MTTLYISDLDGTLLGSDSTVSEESRRIIAGLTKQAVPVTVATARTPATVVPLLAGTGITVPAVVMTGAALWHSDTRRMSHICIFDPAMLAQAFEILASCGISPMVYTVAPGADCLDVYREPAPLNRWEQSFVDARRAMHLKHFHIGTFLPADAAGRVVLLFATGLRGPVEHAAMLLRRDTGLSVSCYPDIFNPDVALIEIFAPSVSKARAMAEVRRITGASRVVAFGDNLNDLPLLRAADVAVAVANAHPDVIAEADVVIGPNIESSVARFIAADVEANR